MNKWIWLLVAAGLAFGYQKLNRSFEQKLPDESAVQQTQGAQHERGNNVLRQAFENHRSNIQVEGEGVVKKTLPDDNKGLRHQRFILKLADGQTLLVAHNIDLADKIKGLKKGDTVGFYGEYEWSQQGGLIHWTHRDPAGRHADGWLKHNGRVYQ